MNTISRKIFLLVLLSVRVIVSHNPHLYTECAVNENGKRLTIFEDSIKFWFVRNNLNFIISIYYDRNLNELLGYNNTEQHKWLNAELKFGNVSQLFILNKFQLPMKRRLNQNTTSKLIGRFVIFSHINILLGCPQGWPYRKLSSSMKYDLQIAASGNEEEYLILTPLADTYVKFLIDGQRKTLCLDHSHSQIKVVNNVNKLSEKCDTLNRMSSVVIKFVYDENNIKILDEQDSILDNITTYNNKTRPILKVLREDLNGTLYIAQCIGNCKKSIDSHAITYMHQYLFVLSIIIIIISVSLLIIQLYYIICVKSKKKKKKAGRNRRVYFIRTSRTTLN